MSTTARRSQRSSLSIQRHPVHSSIALRIHFDGDWTQAEQHVLACAIADVEGLQAPTATESPAVTSWLCYCKRLDGLTVYLAHRAGWQRMLHAYGPHALGLRILLFSQQAQDGVGGYTA